MNPRLLEINFNPRPLAGATGAIALIRPAVLFQSTPPCGGDGNGSGSSADYCISIHAPLRGRLRLSSRKTIFLDFNPRPLAGATAGITA